MIFWILSKMDKFFTVLNVFIKWKFILKFIFQHLQRRSDQQFIISFIGRMSSTVFVPVYQYNIIFQNFLLRFLWCKQEFFPCSAMPSILSVFLAEFGHFSVLLHISHLARFSSSSPGQVYQCQVKWSDPVSGRVKIYDHFTSLWTAASEH